VEQNEEWFIQYPAYLVKRTSGEHAASLAWCASLATLDGPEYEKERLLRQKFTRFSKILSAHSRGRWVGVHRMFILYRY
jgi:hypothetical protein